MTTVPGDDPPSSAESGPQETQPDEGKTSLQLLVEVGPPLLQALAALLGGFALAFAGRFYVPLWLSVAVVLITTAVVVGSGVWSWRARKAMLEGSAKPRASTWTAVGVLSIVLLVAATAPTIVLGLRPTPDYRSPYDGRDPNESTCAQSVDAGHPDEAVPIINVRGAPLGQVLLRRSTRCSTIWAKFTLTPESATSLDGGDVRIVMVRDGDGAKAPLTQRLVHVSEGFGDMLSDGQACVRVELTILTSAGDPVSETARTGCHP